MSTNPAEASRPLIERIRESALGGEVTLPPLPEVGRRLLDLLQDEDRVDSRQLADLIQNDPATTAAVLRVANSAAYGGLREIKDLNQAIARLGVRHVASIVTTLVHKEQFQSEDPARKGLLGTLWHHAVGTAVAARRISDLSGGNLEEAYLAGLLHDTGKLVILRALDQIAPGDVGPVTPSVLEELLEGPHAEVGYEVLRSWNLPEPVVHAARDHEAEPEDVEDGLVLRVQAANVLTRKLGAHPFPDPEIRVVDHPAFDRLALGEIELAALMVDLEDEIDALRSLM
jgi:HD-like signal output (HDOD) protein